MCRTGENIGTVRFNKLAQLETKSKKSDLDDFKLDKSTTVSDAEKLKKRAARKYVSRGLSLALINYVKSILLDSDLPRSELETYEKSFWNMFRCSNTLKKQNGKITAQYCKNRLCMVCNSIRQGEQLNKIVPVIKNWNNARFVTVTGGPTVSKNKIKERLIWMKQVDEGIRKKIQKQYSRGKSEKFIGIKKIECTFSTDSMGYHPHYHYIFKSADIAALYVKEWLIRTSLNGTYEGAQKNIPCDVNTAKELTKYFTKVSTKIDSETGKRTKIYLDSLLYQFAAFRNKRTFTTYGIKFDKKVENRPVVDEDQEILEAIEDENGGPANDFYNWNFDNWFSVLTGESVTNYRLDDRSKNIVKSIRKNYSIYD